MATKKSQVSQDIVSTRTAMNPHLAKGKTPPFSELDAYTFQDLCTDLMGEEPNIIHARVFGDQGQTQYGIDITADKSDDQIEVGQCKRYKTFPPQKIIDASDEFLKHWDTYWKDRNVTRFILFVASEVTKTQSIEEIERQKAQFSQYGVKYELWDARALERKLRPYPQIVAKYCDPPDYWVNRICGIGTSSYYVSATQTQVTTVVDVLLVNQVSEFATKLAENELQSLRALWQEGREEEALSKLDDLRKNPKTWTNASAELKARILCFQASIALESGRESEIVEQLLDEARTYATVPSEQRVRALSLRRIGEFDKALHLLEDIDDIDTRNLRAALLLDSGMHDEASALLQDIVTHGIATVETYRVLALCFVVSGSLDDADTNIKLARAIEPTWIRLKMIEGIIAYYRSLSPVVTPKRLEAFPLPVDWVFVNQDQESISALHFAEQTFSQLLENPQNIISEVHITGWKLASLLNDLEKQDDALIFCKTVLAGNPSYLPAIAWATFRHLEVDFAPSTQLLQDKFATKLYTVDDAVALVTLYAHQDRFADGLQVLTDSHGRFAENRAEPLWMMWFVQILVKLGDFEELSKVATTLPNTEEYEPIQEFLTYQQARRSGQWEDFVAHNLKKFTENQEAGFLFDACIALYQTENWVRFSEYAEMLVAKVGTADAYRYAIFGTYKASQYEPCLRLIEQWQSHFLTPNYQHEFDQLNVACLRSLGKYSEAIVKAEALVAFNPSVTNTLNLVSLLHEFGNYPAVSVYAERLVDADLQSPVSLQLTQFLQGEDDQLAQRFWLKAKTTGVANENIGSLISLAFQLGLDNETGDLYPQLLLNSGDSQQSYQQIQTTDDLLNVIEEMHRRSAEIDKAYRSGVLPVHFYAQELNVTLSDLFHDELHVKHTSGDLLRSRPLYIRYGGRPMVDGFPEPIPNLRIFLDTTALLLAAHLNILDKVEQAFAPLYIPSEILPSLAHMVSRTYHHQPSVIEANKSILSLVSRNKLKIVPRKEFERARNSKIEVEISELSPEWISSFEIAKQKNGYFLTFLPPMKSGKQRLTEPVHLTTGYLRYLLNCQTIAKTLRDRDEIERETYKDALKALGTMAAKYPNVPIPRRAAFILCDDSITHTLVNAGLFEPLCNIFDVHIVRRQSV